jgi:hypothetical protein
MIVKDNTGSVLKGLYRGHNGALVVHDPEEFNKYNREKSSKEEINRLSNEVQQLKELVTSLLREKNG